MTERYPDDATLLALSEDPVTGVSYIPTGLTPYFLEFRKLVQRTLLATQRANDLRVYQDGDLSVGVRGGRVFIGNTAQDVAGSEGVAVAGNATTHVWVDAAGVVQTGTAGLPGDRTLLVPMAEVVTGTSTIVSITDLRGEAFLHIPSLASLGAEVSVQAVHEGDLTGSVAGKLVGAVAADGVVTGVVLSEKGNMVSDTAVDGVSASVRVNGVVVTSTDPAVTSGDGPGFRSTASGDGTAAVIKTDGTEQVRKGDVFTVDLTRAVTGVVTTEASDVVVLVVVSVN